MPSTTAGGLPYPLPTEQAKDGAVAIQNLANALQARTLGLQFVVGQVIVTCNAAGGWGFNFARPFKTGAVPLVLVVDGGATGSALRTLGTMDPASATAVAGVARDPGGNFAANALIRITYLAMGTAP